jgi:hypothetical protein
VDEDGELPLLVTLHKAHHITVSRSPNSQLGCAQALGGIGQRRVNIGHGNNNPFEEQVSKQSQ